MQNTPQRVARMYGELLAGYYVDPVTMINDAIFDVVYDEMVLVRDIEFYSLCEHHMLYLATSHVAYIPRGHVIGFSKIPRIVDMFARRLQVQERLHFARSLILCAKHLIHWGLRWLWKGYICVP